MGLWFWEVAIIEVLCWLFSSAKSSLRVRILMSQECLHGPSCIRVTPLIIRLVGELWGNPTRFSCQFQTILGSRAINHSHGQTILCTYYEDNGKLIYGNDCIIFRCHVPARVFLARVLAQVWLVDTLGSVHLSRYANWAMAAMVLNPGVVVPKNGAKFHSNWFIITLASQSLLVAPRYKWVGKLYKR